MLMSWTMTWCLLAVKCVYDGHRCCRYWNPKCVDRWHRNRTSEYVQIFGSLVTVDSNSTTDIKAWLTIARHATLQLTGIWKAKDIGMDLKKQLVRSLIWSKLTVLYGSESWRWRSAMRNYLQLLWCGNGVGFWESARQNGKPTHGFGRRLVYHKKKAS